MNKATQCQNCNVNDPKFFYFDHKDDQVYQPVCIKCRVEGTAQASTASTAYGIYEDVRKKMKEQIAAVVACERVDYGQLDDEAEKSKYIPS